MLDGNNKDTRTTLQKVLQNSRNLGQTYVGVRIFMLAKFSEKI